MVTTREHWQIHKYGKRGVIRKIGSAIAKCKFYGAVSWVASVRDVFQNLTCRRVFLSSDSQAFHVAVTRARIVQQVQSSADSDWQWTTANDSNGLQRATCCQMHSCSFVRQRLSTILLSQCTLCHCSLCVWRVVVNTHVHSLLNFDQLSVSGARQLSHTHTFARHTHVLQCWCRFACLSSSSVNRKCARTLLHQRWFSFKMRLESSRLSCLISFLFKAISFFRFSPNSNFCNFFSDKFQVCRNQVIVMLESNSAHRELSNDISQDYFAFFRIKVLTVQITVPSQKSYQSDSIVSKKLFKIFP